MRHTVKATSDVLVLFEIALAERGPGTLTGGRLLWKSFTGDVRSIFIILIRQPALIGFRETFAAILRKFHFCFGAHGPADATGAISFASAQESSARNRGVAFVVRKFCYSLRELFLHFWNPRSGRFIETAGRWLLEEYVLCYPSSKQLFRPHYFGIIEASPWRNAEKRPALQRW